MEQSVQIFKIVTYRFVASPNQTHSVLRTRSSECKMIAENQSQLMLRRRSRFVKELSTPRLQKSSHDQVKAFGGFQVALSRKSLHASSWS